MTTFRANVKRGAGLHEDRPLLQLNAPGVLTGQEALLPRLVVPAVSRKAAHP
jgi:hypothetical protein